MVFVRIYNLIKSESTVKHPPSFTIFNLLTPSKVPKNVNIKIRATAVNLLGKKIIGVFCICKGGGAKTSKFDILPLFQYFSANFQHLLYDGLGPYGKKIIPFKRLESRMI